MLAAAPQPEPVDVDPAGYVDYGDRVEWYKKPAPETDLYTAPQPDRVTTKESYVELDIHSNPSRTEQQRKMEGIPVSLLERLKWWVAPKEMEELHRWRSQWEEHRRWLAEFEHTSATLDHMRSWVDGTPLIEMKSISRFREELRSKNERTN